MSLNLNYYSQKNVYLPLLRPASNTAIYTPRLTKKSAIYIVL